MTRPALPTAQLFLFSFGPDARFEGQLGGALQRLESGGTLKILEALFIQRDADTSELVMIDLRGDGAGSLIAPVLDFRLDARARQRATERALAAAGAGMSREALRTLGEPLAPGAAVAALLVEHVWAEALADAVSRTSGEVLANEFVQAATLDELSSQLLGLAAHTS